MIVALEDAKYKLIGLRDTVADLGSAIRINELKESLPGLEAQTLVENFWSDKDNSSKILQTIKQTQDKIEEYERLGKFDVDVEEDPPSKTLMPEDIDYLALKGLRIEATQKLDRLRPLTVGQASRISGVNPADISVLLIYLGLK